MSRQMTPRSILDFWFYATSRAHWFAADATFDASVRDLLLTPLEEATQGRLDFWRGDADGALALCLLFDQAPRNIFRGTAEAFATDPQARDVARHILSCGFDLAYESDEQRAFAYLPFEHSEELADQDLSLRLYTERAGVPPFSGMRVSIGRSSRASVVSRIETPSSASSRSTAATPTRS